MPTPRKQHAIIKADVANIFLTSILATWVLLVVDLTGLADLSFLLIISPLVVAPALLASVIILALVAAVVMVPIEALQRRWKND